MMMVMMMQMTDLIQCMTNVRFAISIWRPIMQNKTFLSFRVVPLPPKKLIKLAFLNRIHQQQFINSATTKHVKH